MKLSELLGLPEGLTDAERGACIAIANHYGAEAARDAAEKILAKRETPCSGTELEPKDERKATNR